MVLLRREPLLPLAVLGTGPGRHRAERQLGKSRKVEEDKEGAGLMCVSVGVVGGRVIGGALGAESPRVTAGPLCAGTRGQ